MKKLAAILAASAFALSTAVLAQTPAPAKPATPAPAAAAAAAKLEKPASVTQEAWDKMSEADRKKAVEAAKQAAAKPAGKPKKGGC